MKSPSMKRSYREWEQSSPMEDESFSDISSRKSASPPKSPWLDNHVGRIDYFFSYRQKKDQVKDEDSNKMLKDDCGITHIPFSIPTFINPMEDMYVYEQDKEMRDLCSSYPMNRRGKKPRMNSPSSKTMISQVSELTLSRTKHVVDHSSQLQHCFICHIRTRPPDSNGMDVHQSVSETFDSTPKHPIECKTQKEKNSICRYFSTPKSTSYTWSGNRNHMTSSTSALHSIHYDDLEPCTFCDRHVCKQRCIQECEMCQGRFCKFCSTVNYTGRLERIYCLDCNGRVSPCAASSTSLITGDFMDLSY